MDAVTTDRKYFTPWRKNTLAAVECRVRRALRGEGQMLRKPRCERERAELGDYFTADAHTGNPERWRVDLDELARELRVLQPHEVIEG